MDTVTHALIGRLTGEALLPGGPEKRALKNWMTGLAALPDADFFMSIGQPFQELVAHRGITHSIFGVAVMAVLLGWLMRRTVGGKRPLQYYMALAALTMLFAHVFYDVATSYGTQILRPFSDLRVSLDWHFILDPFLTGIVVAGLIGARLAAGVKPAFLSAVVAESVAEVPQRRAQLFFVLMLAYTFTMGGLHHLAIKQVLHRAGKDPFFEKAHAFPAPFSPLHWQGLARHAHMYSTHPVALVAMPGGRERAFLRVDNREDGIWGTIWTHPDGKIYRWFSRFITGRIEPRDDGGSQVVMEDLQFRRDLDNLGVLGNAVLTLVRSINPDFDPPMPFRVEVSLAPDNAVESITMRSPEWRNP